MTTSDRQRVGPGFALAFALALALVGSAAPARADSDDSHAVTLFEKGRKLAREGRCAEAVPALLESIRYAEGVGALLNLGNCYESLGKPASAHRYFLRAREVATTKNDPRGDEAEQRARSLEKDLPTVTVHVAPATRGATEVRVDGEPWARERWDIPVPLDPGSHTVEFHVPPAPVETRTVTVAKGEHVGIEPSAAAPAAKSLPNEPKAPAPGLDPLALHEAPASVQRTASFVVGGAGVAGLVVGGIFGAISLETHAKVLDSCPSYPTCSTRSDTTQLTNDNSRAQSTGTLSTIFVIAGLALCAGGAALYLTSDPAAPKKTSRIP